MPVNHKRFGGGVSDIGRSALSSHARCCCCSELQAPRTWNGSIAAAVPSSSSTLRRIRIRLASRPARFREKVGRQPGFTSVRSDREATEVSALVEAAMTLSSCLLEVFALAIFLSGGARRRSRKGLENVAASHCRLRKSESNGEISQISLAGFKLSGFSIELDRRGFLVAAIVPQLSFAIRISTLRGACFKFTVVGFASRHLLANHSRLHETESILQVCILLRLGSLDTLKSEFRRKYIQHSTDSIFSLSHLSLALPSVDGLERIPNDHELRWEHRSKNQRRFGNRPCFFFLECGGLPVNIEHVLVSINIEHVYWCKTEVWYTYLLVTISKTSTNSDPGVVMSRFLWLPSANWRILPLRESTNLEI
ncbi:hypothetical protein C8F01DRAFT_1234319 [Mycena amicta]|nr:hypothetical protein C8F01DRAFT_1234319 [Mycena amicta]